MNLERGMSISSDYSGIMMFEDALVMHMKSLKTVSGFEGIPLPSLHRACDIAPAAQRVILSREMDQPTFLFNDINDRLPEAIRTKLDEMEPPTSAASPVREAAYVDMLSYLMENESLLFDISTTSTDMRTMGKGQLLSPSQVARLDHQDDSRDPTLKDRLNVHVAGSDCLGWTPRGGQLRGAHPSNRPLNIYLTERRSMMERGLEDLFGHECSHRFPSEEKFQQ
eukprot:9482176-Pyramimonas_sp.AAC.1